MDPPADSPRPAANEPLLLVSDTSTEAERLIASLRVRGFKVRDVPLMLLPGRVEAQKPSLLICGGQSPKVIDILIRTRQGAFGAHVPVILLGADPSLVDALEPHLVDIRSRAFPRPIDIYTVLQRIEETVGSPERGDARVAVSMASLPRLRTPISVPSSRIDRPEASSPPREAATPRPVRGGSSLSAPPRGSREPALSSAPDAAVPSRRLPSLPPPSAAEHASASGPPIAAGKMSAELEGLLEQADRRLSSRGIAMHPGIASPIRLTPEEELDAILPPDVLAALEESLGEDEDEDTSNPGLQSKDRVDTHVKNPGVTGTRAGATELGIREGTTGGGSEEEPGSPTPAPRNRAPAVLNAGPGTGSVLERSSPLASTQPLVPSTPYIAQSIRAQAPEPMVQQRPAGPDGRSGSMPASVDDEPGSEPPTPRSRALGAPRGPGLESAIGTDSERREELSTAPPRGATAGRERPSERYSDEERASSSAQRPTGRAAAPRSSQSLTPTDDNLDPVMGVAMGRVSLGPRTERQPLGPHRSGPPLPRATPESKKPKKSETEPATGVQSEPSRPSIPAALATGDVARILAKCVHSRFSGALVVEDDEGIRRVVMRDGDFVTVASGVEGESLVSFLVQRGDLTREALRLERKLPQFGRHAGAALIAHGYVRQDELWPVLRAHAEWLLGRTVQVVRGSASLETELPPRLQSEPTVFGGSTGAEILIEIVRRTVAPEVALTRLGGMKVRLALGAATQLLSECALPAQEEQAIRQCAGLRLGDLLTRVAEPHFASALLALVELTVVDVLPATQSQSEVPDAPAVRDPLDDEVIRIRVQQRRALVDQGDYFSLLGVAHDATGYEVRHAYLGLRREFDPGRLLTVGTADLREDVDIVLEVLDEAYEILREPARRERYRRALDAHPT